MTETVITPEKLDELERLAKAWIEHPTVERRFDLDRAAGPYVVLALIARVRTQYAEIARLREALAQLEEAYCDVGPFMTHEQRNFGRKALIAARAALNKEEK